MQSAITRLALFQFLLVFYCTLGVGIILKAVFGSPAPPIFATRLRDYGFLLLLLPSAWIIWASISAHRPRVGTGDFAPIFISGLALLGFLIVLAFLGTISAGHSGTLIQAVPTPKPAKTNSR